MIAARRLGAQQIARPSFSAPADLVAWMGAIQAQDRAAARWAVGLRLRDATLATVEQALAEGSVLRTHVFRWTWQLVVPADLRWMLALVGSRLMDRAAGRHRELGLDAAAFRRSRAAIARALRGGRHLTRVELAAAIERGGVSAAGPRLSHLLGHAELAALICSGAPRGAQQTHALVDERAPDAGPSYTREEAAVQLAHRYLRSRAPASDRDFAWWSGLSLGDARAALAAVDITVLPPPPAAASAHLLPAYDEYLVSYKDREAVLDPVHTRRVNAGGGLLEPVIVIDGTVVGRWRRTLGKENVVIELEPFVELSARNRRAIAQAAQRYAAFIGRELELSAWGPPASTTR